MINYLECRNASHAEEMGLYRSAIPAGISSYAAVAAADGTEQNPVRYRFFSRT